MSICVNSIGEVTISLKKEGNVNVGDLVMMSSSNQTAKVADNDVDPIGVCVSKNGDYIGVMISGGVTLNCDGGLTTGFHPIKVQTGNKITAGESGKTRLIIDVNTTAKTAQVIL